MDLSALCSSCTFIPVCLTMKLYLVIPLCALLGLSQQAPSNCFCELTNAGRVFPYERLSTLNDEAVKCNGDVTPQKTGELEILMLGLENRLPQLQSDVSVLEREDDGDLYGTLSLLVIENELLEITQLMEKLNSSTQLAQTLSSDTKQQLLQVREEMKELEQYDTMQVVREQQDNKRLKRDLEQCIQGLQPTSPPTPPSHNACPHGRFLNVSQPRIDTGGEYPGSYKFGAWGRDPKPPAGKEGWYWYVPLTSSNIYANYVRRYSSLSSLIVGVSTPGNVQIHSSNPTTNTVQGPNTVVYGEALYYNCYNQDYVCRFNLTTKAMTKVQLPKGTRYNSKGNYCQLDLCYAYTDMDLATDESGVWVIYTTASNFGNLVLTKLEYAEVDGSPTLTLGQTLRTSVYKQAVTNTFMACGVLYATRYVDTETEEIFYSFDTATGVEKFGLGIFMQKTYANIYSLNYSPIDQMLYAYMEAYMVAYKVLFG